MSSECDRAARLSVASGCNGRRPYAARALFIAIRRLVSPRVRAAEAGEEAATSAANITESAAKTAQICFANCIREQPAHEGAARLSLGGGRFTSKNCRRLRHRRFCWAHTTEQAPGTRRPHRARGTAARPLIGAQREK